MNKWKKENMTFLHLSPKKRQHFWEMLVINRDLCVIAYDAMYYYLKTFVLLNSANCSKTFFLDPKIYFLFCYWLYVILRMYVYGSYAPVFPSSIMHYELELVLLKLF